MKANERGELTPQQMEAAALCMTMHTTKMTYTEIAKQVGISRRQLQTWRELPAFIEYQKERYVSILDEAAVEVFNTVNRKATAGHIEFVKLWFTLQGYAVNPAPVQIANVVNSNVDDTQKRIQDYEAQLRALPEQEYYNDYLDETRNMTDQTEIARMAQVRLAKAQLDEMDWSEFRDTELMELIELANQKFGAYSRQIDEFRKFLNRSESSMSRTKFRELVKSLRDDFERGVIDVQSVLAENDNLDKDEQVRRLTNAVKCKPPKGSD